MKKKDISLLLNLILVIFEIIAIIISYGAMKRICIEYYTIDSNLLALASSLIYCSYLIKKKKIPNWLSMFKYLSTVGLTITLIVVIFILYPMTDYNFYSMFISDSLIYHHLLCPIIGIVTFICFDNLKDYSIKDSVSALSFTFIYTVIIITLNVINKVDGPYPFLKVHNQSLLSSIIWFIVLYIIAYFISYVLRLCRNKYKRS